MATTYDPENRLAPVPPRGWNSYNTFGGVYPMPEDADRTLPGGVGLDERVILETADALVASGLRDAGYVYLNLDDRWQDPRRPRDGTGALRADPRRFPNGMKAIGDELHDRGLKFGIYTVGNVMACGGEEGDGAGGIPRTGSLGHEEIDAHTFAGWGVDFLKIDWCGVDEAGNRGRAPEVFARWNEAIAAAGRPCVLSASTWGHEAEHTWAPELTHMWRTGEDLPPRWDVILSTAHAHAQPPWSTVCGPSSGWNDPDMLEVGRPGLTEAESWTHLVLAAMTADPLLMSHDVRAQTPAIRDMLLNRDVLAIDALDTPVASFSRDAEGWEIWRRPTGSGGEAVAVVNLGYLPRALPAQHAQPGRVATYGGPAGDEPIPPHGVRLFVPDDLPAGEAATVETAVSPAEPARSRS